MDETVVEEVQEAVEEVVEAVAKNPKKWVVITGVASLAVGFGIGYWVARRRNADNIANQIEVMNPRLQARLNARFPQVPGKVVAPPPRERTIVVDGSTPGVDLGEPYGDGWDIAKEVPKRTAQAPYIIHQNEYLENDTDNQQMTLTYYAGDGILCDDDDAPMYHFEKIVGPLRFGHGSTDPNVFYVRNEKRKMEYEIIQNPGLYSVEVQGLEIEEQVEDELRHSQHQVRKFRKE